MSLELHRTKVYYWHMLINGLQSQKINGYVYLAKDDMGNVKIGSTNSVDERVKQLKRGCASVEIIAKIKAKRYIYMEKLLHDWLNQYRVKGEWFYSEEEDKILNEVIKFSIRYGEVFGVYFLVKL